MRENEALTVGPRLRRVKALGTILLLGALAGCFWRQYPRLIVTHADLLADMAGKGRDLILTGRFGPEALPELTYPLERAAAFAAEARQRAGASPPRSLEPFAALVANYRQFLHHLDDLRRRPPGNPGPERAPLDATVAALRSQADEVRAAVAGEG